MHLTVLVCIIPYVANMYYLQIDACWYSIVYGWMTHLIEQDNYICLITGLFPRAWSAPPLTSSCWQCWTETKGLSSLHQNHCKIWPCNLSRMRSWISLLEIIWRWVILLLIWASKWNILLWQIFLFFLPGKYSWWLLWGGHRVLYSWLPRHG